MTLQVLTGLLLMAVGLSIAVAAVFSAAYWFVAFVVCLIVTETGLVLLVRRFHQHDEAVRAG